MFQKVNVLFLKDAETCQKRFVNKQVFRNVSEHNLSEYVLKRFLKKLQAPGFKLKKCLLRCISLFIAFILLNRIRVFVTWHGLRCGVSLCSRLIGHSQRLNSFGLSHLLLALSWSCWLSNWPVRLINDWDFVFFSHSRIFLHHMCVYTHKPPPSPTRGEGCVPFLLLFHTPPTGAVFWAVIDPVGFRWLWVGRSIGDFVISLLLRT
jgi:hypothetical protein